MALFTIQRNGFKHAISLAQSVIEDMVDHGFTVIYPSGYVPSSRIADADLSTTDFNVILEAGPDVDPLNSNQPWRIAFRNDRLVQMTVNINNSDTFVASVADAKFLSQNLAIAVATDLQLGADGNWQAIPNSSGTFQAVAGSLGAPFAPAFTFYDRVMDRGNINTGFINRESRFPSWETYTAPTSGGAQVQPIIRRPASADNNNGSSSPLNYRLTITSRGFFLGVFEGNWASIIDGTLLTNDNLFNWVLVQRPVNKDTGQTLVTGKSPVFCVNCVNKQYWRFVVRESDIPHPSLPVRAEYHSEDNFKLINPFNQVSLTEDKRYTVSFIHNLNTPRFRYSEELDMVSIVSSDIIMESVNIPITAYGSNRVYTSLPCNSAFNTGAKVLVLTYAP